MRLHNRRIKATFWNDPDLLQWPRDMRWFYEGLSQLADDSGCLEDSPFAFKLNLYPSPVDADITVDVITEWINKLVSSEKLVKYQAGGKSCIFIKNFHKHQDLKSPEKPEVPLPEWVKWEPYPSNNRTGKYVISYDILTRFLHHSYKVLTPFLEEEVEEEVEEEKKEREECRFAAPPENLFNFPEEYWEMVATIDNLPTEEQLNMLVKQYNKKYPAQFKQYKVRGSTKARATYTEAIQVGILASEILKEILFDVPDEGEPEPAPWDITDGLINSRGLEQTRAQVNYEMALQLERGGLTGGTQRDPPPNRC